MPQVFIFAGPNGAGKTTGTKDFLRDNAHVTNYVNADEIARQFDPENPANANVKAGKFAFKKMRSLILSGTDFTYESTLAGRSQSILNMCLKQNYKITLTYFWLPSDGMAVKRVENRFKQKGHWIPEKDVRQRFFRGLRNLIKTYLPACHRGIILDSTKMGELPRIAEKTENNFIVHNKEIWESILKMAAHENN